MSHEVFDTLNLIRDLQAQYAAFRAQQHFVTAHGMYCATTARLEAIAPKSDHTTLAHWQFTSACILSVGRMSSVRISCGLI